MMDDSQEPGYGHDYETVCTDGLIYELEDTNVDNCDHKCSGAHKQ